MTELTRRELEAMADYLARSTVAEHKRDLSIYLSAPADKREDILSELWAKYGDHISVTKL